MNLSEALFTKAQVEKLVSGKNEGYGGSPINPIDVEGFRGELPDVLAAVAEVLRSGRAIGVKSIGSGYAYYPKNKALTLWASSDGGELRATLLEIMSEYLGISNREFMVYPDEVEQQPWFAKKRSDQAEFEFDNMVGDSMNAVEVDKAIDKLLEGIPKHDAPEEGEICPGCGEGTLKDNGDGGLTCYQCDTDYDASGKSKPTGGRLPPPDDNMLRGGYEATVQRAVFTKKGIEIDIDLGADAGQVDFVVDYKTGKVSASSAMNNPTAHLIVSLLLAANVISDSDAIAAAGEIG